jgi:malate dehydrogenase
MKITVIGAGNVGASTAKRLAVYELASQIVMYDVVGDIAEKSVKVSPKAIYIVVTTPPDVMTQLVRKKTGLPKNRVIGMAGALDNARFRCFLAKRFGVTVSDVHSMVLGSHGDTMVPVLSMLEEAELDQLAARARDGGAEIVKLLKTGSAYSALCEGEFSIKGNFVGVPVRLCRSGIERIVEIPLHGSELKALLQSAAVAKENRAVLGT